MLPKPTKPTVCLPLYMIEKGFIQNGYLASQSRSVVTKILSEQ